MTSRTIQTLTGVRYTLNFFLKTQPSVLKSSLWLNCERFPSMILQKQVLNTIDVTRPI